MELCLSHVPVSFFRKLASTGGSDHSFLSSTHKGMAVCATRAESPPYVLSGKSRSTNASAPRQRTNNWEPALDVDVFVLTMLAPSLSSRLFVVATLRLPGTTGRRGGGGDDLRPGSRVPGDVSHDDHAGAYRHEHPKDEGGELRSPQGYDPILRGRVPGTCHTCAITATALVEFSPTRWSGGI